MKRRRLFFITYPLVLAAGTFALTPRILPSVLAEYRSDIRFTVETNQKRVFLTIDDAPSSNTRAILDVLRKHRVPATFFVISSNVTSEEQLRQIIDDGHTLGNHLKTTKACSKLSFEEFRSDFDACAALLEPMQKARYFRPASDFGTSKQIAYVRSRGYQAFMGAAFPLDHWVSAPVVLTRLTSWLAAPGAIVILHDGSVRGRTTAEVLDRLIPRLKTAGYSFGRLEEEPNQPTPTKPTSRPV